MHVGELRVRLKVLRLQLADPLYTGCLSLPPLHHHCTVSPMCLTLPEPT